MTVRTETAPAAKRSGLGASITGRANVARASEKTRGALTALNMHIAGVVVLGVLNVYLLIHMAFLWQSARSQDADALARQRVRLKTAQISAAPLEGLDGKLANSTEEADGFYNHRLPYAMSPVLTELNTLEKKENVKQTRVQYGYTPLYLNGSAAGLQEPSLTEVRMDASLTGDYRSLVQLINDIERDKTFFLISAVTLTGQQSGTVSLRLKVTTYLRPPHGEEKPETLPPANEDDADAAAPAGGPAR